MSNSSGLPKDTKLFSHQVAGHIFGQGPTKIGVLQHDDGSILKPIDPNDIRSSRELEFYRTVFERKCSESLFLELQKYVPHFMGIWHSEDQEGIVLKYLKLENITKDLKHPSVLDVKIGAQTFDPTASPQKRERESRKYPAAKTLGFRILGMKVHQNNSQDFIVYDKTFGKRQTQDTIVPALHKFFQDNRDVHVRRIIERFLERLKCIQSWFEKQTQHCFYSSSLLFVYQNSEPGANPFCDVRMIDFAHVFVSEGHDENYIFGLAHLIDSFQELLETLNKDV